MYLKVSSSSYEGIDMNTYVLYMCIFKIKRGEKPPFHFCKNAIEIQKFDGLGIAVIVFVVVDAVVVDFVVSAVVVVDVVVVVFVVVIVVIVVFVFMEASSGSQKWRRFRV